MLNRIAICLLLLSTSAYADEAYLPLPDDMSIMEVGAITAKDLGDVTAGHLVDNPAQPLPEDQELLGEDDE